MTGRFGIRGRGRSLNSADRQITYFLLSFSCPPHENVVAHLRRELALDEFSRGASAGSGIGEMGRSDDELVGAHEIASGTEDLGLA